jgi:hypothetical protein
MRGHSSRMVTRCRAKQKAESVRASVLPPLQPRQVSMPLQHCSVACFVRVCIQLPCVGHEASRRPFSSASRTAVGDVSSPVHLLSSNRRSLVSNPCIEPPATLAAPRTPATCESPRRFLFLSQTAEFDSPSRSPSSGV